MPKLWTDTIEAHRREVHDAVLEAAVRLLAQHGHRDLTMSRIAQTAGIGRATLYKYFPEVDAILVALHERHVDAHLDHLLAHCRGPGEPLARLRTVLEAYATLRQGHVGTPIEALLVGNPHVERAHERLHEGLRALLAEGAAAGVVRDDVAPDELATFCLHALTAAGRLPSNAAAKRLVGVILAGVGGG